MCDTRRRRGGGLGRASGRRGSTGRGGARRAPPGTGESRGDRRGGGCWGCGGWGTQQGGTGQGGGPAPRAVDLCRGPLGQFLDHGVETGSPLDEGHKIGQFGDGRSLWGEIASHAASKPGPGRGSGPGGRPGAGIALPRRSAADWANWDDSADPSRADQLVGGPVCLTPASNHCSGEQPWGRAKRVGSRAWTGLLAGRVSCQDWRIVGVSARVFVMGSGR